MRISSVIMNEEKKGVIYMKRNSLKSMYIMNIKTIVDHSAKDN